MCDFENFTGCGQCKLYLSEPEEIQILSPISASDLINIVFKFCIDNNTKRLVLESSTISCVGDIDIGYIDDVECSRENKIACRTLVSSWYRYHRDIMHNALVLVYIANVTSILNSVASDNELIDEAMKLNEALDQLTQQ